MTHDLAARNDYLAVPLRDRLKARRVEQETARLAERTLDYLPPLIYMPSVAGTATWAELMSEVA